MAVFKITGEQSGHDAAYQLQGLFPRITHDEATWILRETGDGVVTFGDSSISYSYTNNEWIVEIPQRAQ